MKALHRVLASAGAAAILVGTAATGMAATTSDAIVNVAVNGIQDGTVSVSITESTPFNDVTYNLTDDTTSTGAMTVTVLDNRGTAKGWTVSLGATDFARGNTLVGSDVEISNFSLIPGTAMRTAGVGTIPTDTTDLDPVQNTAAPLWHADTDEGDGQFDLPLSGTLNVPAGTLVDTYTSTVTVSIVAAP